MSRWDHPSQILKYKPESSLFYKLKEDDERLATEEEIKKAGWWEFMGGYYDSDAPDWPSH